MTPPQSSPQALSEVIREIHATPHLGVIRFAGAGAQALAWLHSVGGSSRTLLEATDHYAAASLTEAIGFAPEHFASERVALALAASAYRRAQALEPDAPVFGLGCAASIATDRPKRGEHRAFVAAHSAFGTASYALTFTKGALTREGEERQVSLLMLCALGKVCGLQNVDVARSERLEAEPPELEPTPQFAPASALRRLRSGEVPWVRVDPSGHLQVGERAEGLALLSGSFNPLHEGHKALADVASAHLGRRVQFELPLVNADKAPIDLSEASRRAAQFAAHAPLFLTRAPLFQQKADLFPKSTFVIGADTAARLVAPRFYGGEAAMEDALDTLRSAGCRFLVAGRQPEGDARFLTLHDIDIPRAHAPLFRALPESAFRRDISSSALRGA